MTSVAELARRLARCTAHLRDALARLAEDDAGGHPAACAALAAWRAEVQPDARPAEFADGLAQQVACGWTLAALTATPRQPIGPDGLDEPLRAELAALDALLGAIDPDRMRATPDPRGEPWTYFYEDFLAVYDPDRRRRAGVYYTPIDVARAMVRITDALLSERLGFPGGLADPAVNLLDPATGTGTFPLAVLDAAVARSPSAATTLQHTLRAIELLPGPCAVARLRLGQRFAELHVDAPEGIELGDGLEPPGTPQRVTVVIGNPPYRRVERGAGGRGSGAWVVDGAVPGRNPPGSLFDDLLDVARSHTIFSHIASLYNLYVYFWRHALWTAFEANGPGPAVVAFVTASSWLTGPGFAGLRQLARELCDDVWVLDLGGDAKGTRPEENVFAIETPVAIAVLVRVGASDRTTPARVHYRRVEGTARDKLDAMATIAQANAPLDGPWATAPDGWTDPVVTPTGDDAWAAMPALADLFPWQMPGCMFNRSWPIAPSPELLVRRWEALSAADRDDKPALFYTAPTGRNVDSCVGDLPPLAMLGAGAPHRPIVRYGFRSFDAQWTFEDARVAALERPALWRTRSGRQVYLTTLMTAPLSAGPCLTATVHVPDKHHFNGRGGKDVIPLFRDADATIPNTPPGLLDALGDRLALDRAPGVEDLAAYVFALLTAPGYAARFADALQTPGPRVPLTSDPLLWDAAVALGGRLLWLQTGATRFRDERAGRGAHLPDVAGLRWDAPVGRLPESPHDVRYLASTAQIAVGDGRVGGVSPEVWGFAIGGMRVVPKWLGYRTRRGAGRAARSTNALDRIRPERWHDDWNDELLDLVRTLHHTIALGPAQDALLASICGTAQITARDLPTPTEASRRPPG